jgi:hypothetical protein
MRTPRALLAVMLLLLLAGGAVAARSHWSGAGSGTASSGSGSCSVAFSVSVDQTSGNAWDIRVTLATTSTSLCVIVAGTSYSGIAGSPQGGWRKVFTDTCGLRSINIGAIGSLPAGASSVSLTNVPSCGGLSAYGTVAFVAEDPI